MIDPRFHTPAELAEAIGCSERTLRKLARNLGACHVIGKTMILTDDDVKVMLEATRPGSSPSTDAEKSDITGARLPSGSYEEVRALLTRQPRSASQRAAPGPTVPDADYATLKAARVRLKKAKRR